MKVKLIKGKTYAFGNQVFARDVEVIVDTALGEVLLSKADESGDNYFEMTEGTIEATAAPVVAAVEETITEPTAEVVAEEAKPARVVKVGGKKSQTASTDEDTVTV